MFIFYGTNKKSLWYVAEKMPPHGQPYVVIYADTRLQAEVKLFTISSSN